MSKYVCMHVGIYVSTCCTCVLFMYYHMHMYALYACVCLCGGRMQLGHG